MDEPLTSALPCFPSLAEAAAWEQEFVAHGAATEELQEVPELECVVEAPTCEGVAGVLGSESAGGMAGVVLD